MPAIRSRYPRRATVQRADDRRYMVTEHSAAADRSLAVIKGDPDEVLALCRWRLRNGIVGPLEGEDRRQIAAENLTMANDALRVLGRLVREVDCYRFVIGDVDDACALVEELASSPRPSAVAST